MDNPNPRSQEKTSIDLGRLSSYYLFSWIVAHWVSTFVFEIIQYTIIEYSYFWMMDILDQYQNPKAKISR